jgi:hypothetical protein
VEPLAPLTTSLEPSLHLFDRADHLWLALYKEWMADDSTVLVVPSPLAAERLLRKESRCLWKERIITLSSLWRDIGDAAKLRSWAEPLPRPLQTVELRMVLRDLLLRLDFPQELKSLAFSRQSLDALIQHLIDIEERADVAYQPQTPIEHGIQRLRETLRAQGRSTNAGYRTAAARVSKYYDAGHRFVFSPLGLPSPHIGGLLKGLSEHQSVHAFFLTSLSQKPLLLEALILPEAPGPDAKGFASTLFTRHTLDDALNQWVETKDEQGAIIETVAEWIESGVALSDIGIITADAPGQFVRISQERGVPLVIRHSVQTLDIPLGARLLRISHGDHTDLTEEEAAILFGEKPQASIPFIEDFQQSNQGSNADNMLADLRRYHQLGLYLLEQEIAATLSTPVARGFRWLEGLQRAIEHFESLEIHPPPVQEVLLEITGWPSLLGDIDGVAVVSYTEAPSFVFSHAAYGSLSVHRYPPAHSRSPFVSSALLEAVPRMAEPSLQPEFVAAVATAKHRVFFRSVAYEGTTLAPSPYWEETRRSSESPSLRTPPVLQTRDRVLRRAAGKRTGLQEIEKVLPLIRRDRLPEGINGGKRNSFSVTELESFASCPYGWFVSHILRPQTATNAAQLRGIIVHDMLYQLLQLAPSKDAHNTINELMETHSLTTLEKNIMRTQILRVLNAYSGEAWPYSSHELEISLSSSSFFSSGIHGRADRIDLREEGLLTIDYKNRRSPTQRKAGLQEFLYPLMAQEHFKTPVDGMIYISVFHCDHSGSLRVPVPGLERNTDLKWQEGLHNAQQEVELLLKRIRAGEWNSIGSGNSACPSYCSHHYLSRTVGHG